MTEDIDSILDEIEKIGEPEQTPKLNTFNTKSIVRLIIFSLLGLVSYVICTVSLFYSNGFITPIISFIVLFLLIYFIALDCYKIKLYKVLAILFIIFLSETILFIIFSGFSRYLIAELVLFNITIGTLLFLLDWQLNNRTYFSPFSYFTEGGFFVTTLLTVFFCVLMMGKYTQIPFTCDDIESFPEKVVETTVNPFKNTWNKILGWFKTEEIVNNTIEKPNLYVPGNPLTQSKTLSESENIQDFFTKFQNLISGEGETFDIKTQASKTACNQYIGVLQKTQKSGGVQAAGIIIGYLLLVGIFKILLWIVSVIGFILFIVLRIFGVYKYEKRTVEKEVIV